MIQAFVSFVVVGGLFCLGYFGAESGLGWLFGIVLPYIAAILFLGGLINRVVVWAKVPVPFRIPTTCGQHKSLPWLKQEPLDNPHNTSSVMGRMALEVLFFRSLLRNTKTALGKDGKLVYTTDLLLWIGAMAFHWSLLAIVVRHLRLLADPVPFFVTWVQAFDGFLEVGAPVFYLSSLAFLAALAFLLFRRLALPQMRYISLINDYFPLFLLLGIGLSGFCLRHLFRTNIVEIKELAVGLVMFSAAVPEAVHPLFYGHLFLVCVLLAYFPFSKLVHMAGVFLSPTRNLASNNRMVRHVNPWDYPVKVHTYEEYEDDFRDKMTAAGIPVERE